MITTVDGHNVEVTREDDASITSNGVRINIVRQDHPLGHIVAVEHTEGSRHVAVRVDNPALPDRAYATLWQRGGYGGPTFFGHYDLDYDEALASIGLRASD
jgi:uncharacterized protein (DUF736 family)